MNVKELKELLKDAPDNYEVYYEYDGPETTTEILAKHVIVSTSARCILLCESENLPDDYTLDLNLIANNKENK